MNKIIITGRITADPELRQTQNGVATCNFTIAANRKFKDKETGEYKADFINCTAWRATAEFVAKYFKKGSFVVAEGTLQNNNYEKDGVKHFSYVVVVDNVEFGGKSDGSNSGTVTTTSEPENIDLSGFEELGGTDDLPF